MTLVAGSILALWQNTVFFALQIVRINIQLVKNDTTIFLFNALGCCLCGLASLVNFWRFRVVTFISLEEVAH